MLARIEKAEHEYERLKKLYQECIVEFNEHLYKGVIIENSLKDKRVLDKIKIEHTHQSGDRIIHDVSVNEAQISEIATYLVDGPWYIHFWEPGKDTVRVVFKDKVFTIQHKDETTWADAIAYGKSIGIPEDQLDFPIH